MSRYREHGKLWALVQNVDKWQFCGYADAYSINFTYSFVRDQWTHFVITYDGNTTKVYINDDEFYIEKNMSLNTGNALELWIARCQFGWGYTNLWKGKIDEFRIYSRSLSEEEIQALYNSP